MEDVLKTFSRVSCLFDGVGRGEHDLMSAKTNVEVRDCSSELERECKAAKWADVRCRANKLVNSPTA